jgi:CBS domain-containing protein
MAELTAAEIMTRKVVTLSPDQTLREAAEVLAKHRISGAPVVDADARVIGVLSEADLIDPEKRRVKLPRTSFFGIMQLPESVLREAFDEGATLTVRDLMTRKVVTLPDDATTAQVVDAMVGRRVNRIPITRDGRLAGIITREDVLGVVRRQWGVPDA